MNLLTTSTLFDVVILFGKTAKDGFVSAKDVIKNKIKRFIMILNKWFSIKRRFCFTIMLIFCRPLRYLPRTALEKGLLVSRRLKFETVGLSF